MKAKFINYYISNYLFVLLISLLTVFIFIAAYYEGDGNLTNYIDGVIFFLNDQVIYIIVILISILINSFNVLFRFEKLSVNLLRLEDKKVYFNYLIKTCLKVNTVLFCFIVFIIFLASFCLISKNILFLYNVSYKTYNFIYLLVYLFKIYFICQWLGIVSILLYKINKIVPIILNLVIYLNMMSQTKIISSIFNMPLLISGYLISNQYSSFNLLIICFAIYSLFLIVIANSIYKLCIKIGVL